mmetsp:Transcript_26815/g.63025  ORF Transcript_26815/g.63025 Transcript_26815/m.63025 type:complete len:654 (-) Transcript_26815:903-2864(-)
MVAFNASKDTGQTLCIIETEEHPRDDSENEDEEATSSMSHVERRHYLSTVAVSLLTFTQSWLLVSVFPYSGFMVIRLVPGTDEENAGSHAGLLAASYMIGRALTSYGWGRISDTYGRRIVFYVSMMLSAMFSLLFGLSSTFGRAFLWRFFLGASNGVAGVAKAVVSETAQGNENLETRGMSLSMGMWAWGFLLSPAISGFLSDPIRQYPDLGIWASSSSSSQDQHSPMYTLLHSYPFLLPNLISVLLCVIDLMAVAAWVPETLPPQDLRSASNIPLDVSTWLRTVLAAMTNTIRNTNGSRTTSTDDHDELLNDDMIIEENLAFVESESLLSNSAVELQPTHKFCRSEENLESTKMTTETEAQDPPEVTNISYLWSKTDTRNHLIVFWIISFVFIAVDEAFPLFCISKEGGLGLSEVEIGKLLSATGVIFAVAQYHVYGWIVDRYGIRRSIQIGAVFSAPLVIFVPISLLLNSRRKDAMNDEQKVEEELRKNMSASSALSWSAFLFLSLLLGFIRILGLVFFSSIAIATNRTVKSSHRGTVNGLSMLGGSIAKGLGPIVAGWLVSFAISSGVFAPKAGAVMVFVIIGTSSAIAAGITFSLLAESTTNESTNSRRENYQDSGLIEIPGNGTNGIIQQPLIRDKIVLRQSKDKSSL